MEFSCKEILRVVEEDRRGGSVGNRIYIVFASLSNVDPLPVWKWRLVLTFEVFENLKHIRKKFNNKQLLKIFSKGMHFLYEIVVRISLLLITVGK